MSRTARFRCAAALLAVFAVGPGAVAAGDIPSSTGATPPVPIGELSFTLPLARDVPAAGFAAAFPGLATWGYFGLEPLLRAAGKPLTATAQFTSRSWPGLRNVDIDAGYCPGAATPAVRGGQLIITASHFSPADVQRCGLAKRDWGSSLITSQPGFAQTYGYWDIEAKLPCDSGRWPAFWLLPVAHTATNGGRLAEVDVFEHYGGTISVISQGKPYVINRIGQPFSTLHYGTSSAEKKYTNGQSLPKMADAQRQAFCQAWHHIGVLWTRQEFRFYVDGKVTLATPNPGVDDPHYWVVSLDISASAGDPDRVPGPSQYCIRQIRVWKLPKAVAAAPRGKMVPNTMVPA